MANSNELLSDQWKTAGDCNFCRRRKYCRKSCSLHKQRINAMIANTLSMELAKQYMKAVREERGAKND